MQPRFLHSQEFGEFFLPYGYELANILVGDVHCERIVENEFFWSPRFLTLVTLESFGECGAMRRYLYVVVDYG